jgi:flagellar basal-body rod protein FlgC
MEAVTSNLANMRTTRTPEGGPYRRLFPVFVAEPVAVESHGELGPALRSVRIERIAVSDDPPRLQLEPGHPDADAEGYVAYPSIEPLNELVDMMSAVRSYEAGVSLIRGVRGMMSAALEIVR